MNYRRVESICYQGKTINLNKVLTSDDTLHYHQQMALLPYSILSICLSARPQIAHLKL